MDPELKAALDALTATAHGSIDALIERMDKIETRQNRPGMGVLGGTERPGAKSHAYKVYENYLRRGPESLDPGDRKALVASDDTAGGFLAPPEMVTEILRNVVLFSPVREAARVGQTMAGEVKIPKRTGTLTAKWVGEVETRSSTEPSYGQISIPINEGACYVDISTSLMEDTAVNMGAELAFDLGEEFGRLEGEAFVTGNGIKKPEGFLSNTDIVSVNSGAATTVTADGLIDLMYALAPFYRVNSTWMMNGSTLAKVRKMKDGDGSFLWQPSLAAGQPATLLSRPVVEAVDMPDTGAGAFPIVLGDFNQGYRVYDRVQLGILRDPYSLATTGQTRFHARRRVGAGVAKPEAFKIMKCSA